MAKLHTDKTSAADKIVGFEYQYYYFLWRLLTIKTGQSVGLEVMDDVHTDLADTRQILVQLKHTIDKKADGSIKNLTTLDSDLWKTLSNWSKVISDAEAKRTEQAEQLAFIEKTDFLLVSNKTDNENNKVLKALRELTTGATDFNKVKESFQELYKSSDSKDTKQYISDVLTLNDEVLENFLRHISFDLDNNEIIEKCKTAIRELFIDDKRVDDVFSSLDSKLREENFSMVKNKEKINISYDEFRRKFRIYFDKARNERLVIKRLASTLPDKLNEQKFIQQLIEINDISPSDSDSMAIFTRQLLLMKNNLEEWCKNGHISTDEIEDLKREAKHRWKSAYHSAYRNACADDEIIQKALTILDAMRKEKLSIFSQELTAEISNGQFYDLSNTPEIGWHKDWEGKYK